MMFVWENLKNEPKIKIVDHVYVIIKRKGLKWAYVEMLVCCVCACGRLFRWWLQLIQTGSTVDGKLSQTLGRMGFLIDSSWLEQTAGDTEMKQIQDERSCFTIRAHVFHQQMSSLTQSVCIERLDSSSNHSVPLYPTVVATRRIFSPNLSYLQTSLGSGWDPQH